MAADYELISKLTFNEAPQGANSRFLYDFAAELGWKPSDVFDLPNTEEFSSGHLVIEHGLQNAAVLSFLRSPRRYSDLGFSDRKSLFNASYNNLIDWHILVDAGSVNFVYTRHNPPAFYVDTKILNKDLVSNISGTAFNSYVSRAPLANVPALDSSL